MLAPIKKWLSGGRVKAFILALLLVASNLLAGFPADMVIDLLNESKIVDNLYLASKDPKVVEKAPKQLPKFVQKAKAANFSIQTGYYVGTGSSMTISGVGFQPELVIIRAATTAGQGIWKSSAMPASNSAFFSATANNTASLITFTSGGFTLASNANVSSANVRYTWTAFAGSDCTATGTFCVGTYTGNGSNPRKITTGFQPAFVLVKRTTNLAGGASFRTASMATNVGQYTLNTAQVTTGALFTTLDTDGFNVGTTNNTNAGVYYYIAFKAVSGIMAEGTYTGNSTDNRNITGFGASATPNYVIVKNATSATTASRNTVMNSTYSHGDHTSYMAVTTTNAVNMIQKLQADGFQVGTAAQANESSQTIYWVAFGGASGVPAGDGTFSMANGSYTGNGTSQSVSGLGFAPDLVIIKDSAANYGVFRTSLMAANNTAYLANAAANFTAGITSINGDGFSIGSSTVVNTSSNTYHWQAFGNAYKPNTRSGSSDFAIGTYTGTGTDSRDINELPFQPDMVVAKRNGTTAGVWRSSANSGDSSSFFAATADGANRIQSLNTFGYQIGTTANVNTSGSTYNWFAFKSGDNFKVGSYTGNGGSQTINVGMQPELVWVKRSTNAAGTVHRGESLAGDATQYFLSTANFTGGITSLVSNGFTLAGTTAATNANSGTYRYAAWRAPPPPTLSVDIVDSGDGSVANPSVAFSNLNASLACQDSTGTLGISSQKIRVSNTTANGNWTLTLAATGGSTANWGNGTNTYDYNDANGSPAGCADGGDTDSLAGRLTIDASPGTITPEGGCSTSGITKGSSSAFAEGSINSITLLTASSSQTGCYFDLTGIDLLQKIPGETPADVQPYSINLTITVTAS